MLRRLLSAAVLVASTNLAFAQDIDNGAIAFKKCIICHKIGPVAINGIGPGLNGLDGRPAVSAPYFSYSDANKNSGIVWNEQIFEEYIKDPKAKIPETKKIFAGIKNEKEPKTCGHTLSSSIPKESSTGSSAAQQANRASSEIAGLEPRRPSCDSYFF